jgi:hypothetical protein
MPTRQTTQPISSSDVIRAFFIDFEGFAGSTPALLGILVDGMFEQVVLDERLSEAARAKGLRVSSLLAEVEHLLTRCEQEGRQIVAFSQYERNTILDHCGIDLGAAYRDARKAGKRWWNRTHEAGSLPRRDLKSFLTQIDYYRPAYLGEKKSTHRIRGVLEGLQARGSYERLTVTQKGKWTRLLQHNRIDCFGMAALVSQAANSCVPCRG